VAGVTERRQNIALALKERAALLALARVQATQRAFLNGKRAREAEMARLPDSRLAPNAQRAFNPICPIQHITNLHLGRLLPG
jgi:hypothetical protein